MSDSLLQQKLKQYFIGHSTEDIQKELIKIYFKAKRTVLEVQELKARQYEITKSIDFVPLTDDEITEASQRKAKRILTNLVRGITLTNLA